MVDYFLVLVFGLLWIMLMASIIVDSWLMRIAMWVFILLAGWRILEALGLA